MATIKVSRQTVNDENQLSWDIVTIEEEDLRDGEAPYDDPESLVG
jgi:hypothetical protein